MKRLAELVPEVCDLATQAGEQVMHFYRNGANVTFKADASPLTAADRGVACFSGEVPARLAARCSDSLRRI